MTTITWTAQSYAVSDDELMRLYEQECEALWKLFLLRSGVTATRITGSDLAKCCECWSDERVSGLLGRVMRTMRARSLRPRRKTLTEIAAARIPPAQVDDPNLAGLHEYVPDELYLKWGIARAVELKTIVAGDEEELKKWMAHPRIVRAFEDIADSETAETGRADPPRYESVVAAAPPAYQRAIVPPAAALGAPPAPARPAWRTAEPSAAVIFAVAAILVANTCVYLKWVWEWVRP